MSETVTVLLLTSLMILGTALCILGPLAAFGVMFWHWQRELKETLRIRRARTTQIR
jgi:hypothetical protein